MKYWKIVDFWKNTPNEPCTYRTKNLVEINDGSERLYSTGS